MIITMLATAALGAPSSDTCSAWATQLKQGAADALVGLDQLDDPRIRGLTGDVRPGPVVAKVHNGACHIASVTTVDLKADLTVDSPFGALRCPVQVRKATVPLQVVIGGTKAAPQVRSSELPLTSLEPWLDTCVPGGWVNGAVLSVAENWVGEQKPAWHRQLEAWLRS